MSSLLRHLQISDANRKKNVFKKKNRISCVNQRKIVTSQQLRGYSRMVGAEEAQGGARLVNDAFS